MKLVRVPLAAACLLAAACVSVQEVKAPAEFFAESNPDLVVVTFNDHSEVPVADPTMRGDTIFGTWHGLGEPIVVPMNQVQRIDAMQKNGRRTGLMVAALSAVTAVSVYGFTRAVTNHGTLCDHTTRSIDPYRGTYENKQCVNSGPG